MEEELTSDVAPETSSSTDSTPVESGQSDEQTPMESTEPRPQTDAAVTSEPAKGKDKPVNLYDIPEFRQFQSQMTQKQQEREHQLQQQLQQYEQRMIELEDANLDDYQKAEKRAERAEGKLYQFQQQMQQQQMQDKENQRILEDMQRIHDKTGIPIENLYEASSYDDALDMGIAFMKEEGASTIKQEEAKREANRTIIGGGKASTPTSRRDKELNSILDGQGSPADYLRLLRESK